MPGGNIFISYRRGPDENAAGRLFEALEDKIGEDRIFMDVDGIPPGVDFVDHLNERVSSCEAFLAVIGPGWHERMKDLHKEDDFVRLEYEAALGLEGTPFIPIFFHNAAMPGEGDLPESLHALPRKNGFSMPHEHFSSVMSGKLLPMLSDVLGEDITRSLTRRSWWSRLGKPYKRALQGIGGVIGIAGLSAAALTLITGGLGWFYNASSILKRGEIGSAALTLSDDRSNFSRIDFSASGEQITSGDSNLAAKIWDIKTGQVVKEFKGHSDRIEAAVFSDDGTRLATASQDGTARLWDVDAVKELLQLKGHSDFVYSVQFSPDGTKLVTGSKDKTARVWDAVTGEQLMSLDGHEDEVEMAKFSPDGSVIATASLKGVVRIWDAQTGIEIEDFDAHTGAATGLDFSPAGDLLATVGDDGAIAFWRTEDWSELDYIQLEQGRVTSVEFAPDGVRIVAAATDGSTRIWDVDTMQELGRYYDHGTTFYAAAFSEDGGAIASASHTKLVVREVKN